MSFGKIGNRIAIGLFIPMMVSLVFAISVSGRFSGDPTVPNNATGHTIELSVRGMGTRYLTQTEWDSIALYWHAFYIFLALLIAFVVGYFIYVGWQGFISEWRKPD
ncbi:MAG TPA: hypothetical protein VG328_05015 [Stellaceae bacterium]|jgi:hypothetical protein|nr:hypothetical protein [Stellaceae bacterium]